MIKGHAKIELFNAETGDREKVYEGDNLVTNATKYLLAYMTKINRQPSNEVFPIATNALGGIMLFDKELPEDPDNIDFPSDAKLVGYSDRSTNTSDTKRGSFNATESGPTDDGYVAVWDFGTSQANGNILSVCLTSNYAGANPYIKFVDRDIAMTLGFRNDERNASYRPILYYNGYLYFLRGNEIARAAFNPYRMDSVHNGTGVANLMLEESVGDITDAEFFNDWRYLFDGNKGTLYSIHFHHPDYYVYHDYPIYKTYYPYSNDGNDKPTLSIRRIKYSDGSWGVGDEEVVELPNAQLRNIEQGYQCCSNDYLYWVSSSNASIYIINLNNTADVKEIKIGDTDGGELNIRVNNTLRPYLKGDGIAFTYVFRKDNTDYYRAGFIYSDGTMSMSPATGNRPSEESSSYSTYKFPESLAMISRRADCFNISDQGSWNDYANGIHLMAAYLGTINNLGTAIEKNASQTMKVTYTLKDVAETSSSDDTGDTTTTEATT